MSCGDGWHDVIDGSITSLDSGKPSIEQHLTFLDFAEDGKLLLGSCNFVDRTHTGSIWAFSQPDLPVTAESSIAHHQCASPVSSGAFVGVNQVIAAEDTGIVVSYQLSEFENNVVHFVPQHYTQPHDSWVTSLSVCHGGDEVISGGADMRINVLEGKGSAVKSSYYPAHAELISCVAASSDNSFIFASCSMDRTTLLWDTRISRPAKAVVEGDCGYTAVAWKDENYLAVGSEMGMVHVYDMRSLESVHDLPLQKMPVHKLAFSKAGLLASCSDSTDIRLWRFESNKMLLPESQHSMFIRDLAWHPKSETLFSCGLDGNVFCYPFS
uniref:Methylosome protein 50 n=1 Tax=Lygus hesperus TaxID=30085 RepID=A0A0A9Y315_LYGHE